MSEKVDIKCLTNHEKQHISTAVWHVHRVVEKKDSVHTLTEEYVR